MRTFKVPPVRQLLDLLISATLLVSLSACPSLEHVLRSYGYLPVEPPSTLLLPGSIVWVRNSNPREFGLVCSSSQVLGPNADIHRSTTKNLALRDATFDGITVAGNLVSNPDGRVGTQSLRSLEMSLSNAQVLEIDDAMLGDRVGQLSKGCLAAIAGRRHAGYDVTMIASALQADVTYLAGWSNQSSLSASGKIAELKDVAAQLSLDANQITETSIAANALIWGVRDDQYLVSLVAPEMMEVDPSDPNRALLNPTQASFGKFITQTLRRW